MGSGGAAAPEGAGKRFFIRAEDMGEKFSGVLANYCRYVQEPDGLDSNRRRWPTADYWLNLLGAARRIRLYEKPGAEYNLSDLEHYVYLSLIHI